MFVSLNQSSNLIVSQGPFLAQNVCIRGLEGSAHFNLRDRVQCMEPPSELVSTYSTKKIQSSFIQKINEFRIVSFEITSPPKFNSGGLVLFNKFF